ncbi:MAG: serine hydrolase [Gammaproteobacteria bacterium]
MNYFRLAIVLATVVQVVALIMDPRSALAAKPLAEAAQSIARKLPKGSIVTAERSGERVQYAAAGKREHPGIPPERVIFEIGSITKVFTGLLLAQAVLERKVALDTPIKQMIAANTKFADSRVGAITLKQLATHTSGLPRMPDNINQGADAADPAAHYDRTKLDAYLASAKLPGEAPFEVSYSNLGVGLLGDLLSRVYGKPWEVLVAEKITGPLGLKDTVVNLSDDQRKRFAPPYAGAQKVKPWALAALAGAGALRSSAADMMIFGDALLAPEKTPLMEAFALMLQPQTAEGNGLAISIGKLDGKRVFEHNGGTGGYRSSLQALPDSRSVRVVLVNNAELNPESVLAATRDEKPRSQAADKTLNGEELAGYEGIYSLASDAKFTILRRGDRLWRQFTGQAFLPLFPHEAPDRFFLKDVAAELQFNRRNDKLVSLTYFHNGREMSAKKTDDPLPKIKFRSAKELATYTGTYKLASRAVFTLKVMNETLFARLTGQGFLPVFEKRDNWFEYDVVEAALEFERNKAGKVIALKLHQDGLIQRAVRK